MFKRELIQLSGTEHAFVVVAVDANRALSQQTYPTSETRANTIDFHACHVSENALANKNAAFTCMLTHLNAR